MARLPRVYIDTNVIVSHLVLGSRFAYAAGNFFRDIKHEKVIGVTSSINKTEFLSSMKRIYSSYYRRNPDPDNIAYFEKMFDNLIRKMDIKYYDADTLTRNDSDLFGKAFSLVKKTKTVSGPGSWKMINLPDALVVLMAEKTDSDQIITNDDGFGGIDSKVDVKILRKEHPDD